MSKEYKLETEFEKLHDQKLASLKAARAATGVAKTEHLEKFLQLNKEQEKLEAELDKLEND